MSGNSGQVTQRDMIQMMYTEIKETNKTAQKSLEETVRLGVKLDTLQETTDKQQEQIDGLVQKAADNSATTNIQTVTDKIDKVEKKISTLDTKITALENRAGNTALAVWKKIGTITLTAAVSAAVTYFIAKIKR